MTNQTALTGTRHGVDRLHKPGIGVHFIESRHHHFLVWHGDGKPGNSQHTHCIDRRSGVLGVHLECAVDPVVAMCGKSSIVYDRRQTVCHRTTDDRGDARAGGRTHGSTDSAHGKTPAA